MSRFQDGKAAFLLFLAPEFSPSIIYSLCASFPSNSRFMRLFQAALWHLSRQPPSLPACSSRFALHSLRALETCFGKIDLKFETPLVANSGFIGGETFPPARKAKECRGQLQRHFSEALFQISPSFSETSFSRRAMLSKWEVHAIRFGVCSHSKEFQPRTSHKSCISGHAMAIWGGYWSLLANITSIGSATTYWWRCIPLCFASYLRNQWPERECVWFAGCP